MNSRFAVSLTVTFFVAAGGAATDTLVQNPGFEASTTGRTLASYPSVVAAYSSDDAANDRTSGSASVTNIYSGPGTAVTGYH
jgi:hypothetical protein